MWQAWWHKFSCGLRTPFFKHLGLVCRIWNLEEKKGLIKLFWTKKGVLDPKPHFSYSLSGLYRPLRPKSGLLRSEASFEFSQWRQYWLGRVFHQSLPHKITLASGRRPRIRKLYAGLVTSDGWHMTNNSWGEVSLLAKFQLPSFFGLGVKMFWKYFQKGYFNELIYQ